MKKILLIVLLVVAAFYLVSQRYALKTGRSQKGEFNAVIVEKTSGKVYRLMGN